MHLKADFGLVWGKYRTGIETDIKLVWGSLILHQCAYRGLVLVTRLALPRVHKVLELGTGYKGWGYCLKSYQPGRVFLLLLLEPPEKNQGILCVLTPSESSQRDIMPTCRHRTPPLCKEKKMMCQNLSSFTKPLRFFVAVVDFCHLQGFRV